MTDAQNIDDLIARLQNEPEGSWEINEIIARALGWKSADRGSMTWWQRPEDVQENVWRQMPFDFSGKLDAAISSLPEHFSYEITFSAAGEGAMRRCRAWDWRRSPPMADPGNRWEAIAKNLPCAVVACALKARQS